MRMSTSGAVAAMQGRGRPPLHQRALSVCPSLVACWPLGAPEALTLNTGLVEVCIDPLGGFDASFPAETPSARPMYNPTGLDGTTKTTVFGDANWLTSTPIPDESATWAAWIVLCELNSLRVVNWALEWGNPSGGASGNRGLSLFFHQNNGRPVGSSARGDGAGAGFCWRQGSSPHVTTSKLVSRTYSTCWDTTLESNEISVREDEIGVDGVMVNNGTNAGLGIGSAPVTLGNVAGGVGSIGIVGNISWVGLAKGTGTPPTAAFDAVGALLKAARAVNDFWT